jgi:hypothetical protein
MNIQIARRDGEETLFVGFPGNLDLLHYGVVTCKKSANDYSCVRAWIRKHDIPLEYASHGGIRTGLIFREQDAVAFLLKFSSQHSDFID